MCLGLWYQKALFLEKSMYFLLSLKCAFNDIIQYNNQIKMRWFIVKCGKVKCPNSFCISLTRMELEFSIIKSCLNEEQKCDLSQRLCIWWNASLKVLETASEIRFVLHIFEATKRFALKGSFTQCPPPSCWGKTNFSKSTAWGIDYFYLQREEGYILGEAFAYGGQQFFFNQEAN